MFQVVVAGYNAGKARSFEGAENLVFAYMEWLDESGKFDLGVTVSGFVVVPYVFKRNGRVVYEGEAKLEAVSSPVPLFIGQAN
ncbi:hypothetical protein GXB81_21000 [Paraburkholderia sp. Ac-20336]|uniref:hypothetical protein n=1 Tax=Burkholderiaceae TaxID=119060 RepID=UPI001421F82F|nr:MULTISPECIES: hypothetical protein [Burkholderiaceae]MBN3805510.1 hypothetical protein [Paraburkholderia sp. Ac-20336]NIF55583.1 hypothetical protein [Burkholderia sp. Ax-1724]